MKKGLFLLLTFVMFCLPTFSIAADYDQFRQDAVAAYGFYKKALSLTSKSDKQKKSIETVEKFLNSWTILADKYAQDAPAPFTHLTDYSKRMKKPLAIGKQALDELKSGEIASAHSTLEGVRYLLWNMRTVSGQVSLSDKVNDFHEVMEIVLDLMHKEESATNYRKVENRYGAWLEIKWEEHAMASTDVFSDERETFKQAMTAGHKAVSELRAGLAAGDTKAANAAGKKVKKAYKTIFFLNSTT